jgi:hypothetical protein
MMQDNDHAALRPLARLAQHPQTRQRMPLQATIAKALLSEQANDSQKSASLCL